jgi:hypothetical protein
LAEEKSGDKPRLHIRLIAADDKLNKLRLKQEDGALGAFLQRTCLSYHNANIAKT